ncbi:hypothetical protein AX16_002466 [Volvariella volvacea WC 439]|nr:hypothetical protein AX16_002466 [Volvariella volvacea WC 439]
MEHLRFLSWEHFDAAFTNAKLELDNEFFSRTTELRSIEVKTEFTDFLDAIEPITDHIHAPVKLDLHEEESPSIQYLPRPHILPSKSGPFLSCPNLSDIEIILPHQYRKKSIDIESGFNKEQLPDSTLSILQEVAKVVNIC